MLEVRDLRRHFGTTRALDGLDLDARRGEVLGIAGPNGAGKSTLVRLLAGEDEPTSGSIAIDAAPWSPSIGRGRVAVVHQEPQLFPNLSLAANMMVGREPAGVRRPSLPPEDRRLLEELDIARFARQPVGKLSLAVQQRTEIARALARDADLFLFDEPNSALTEEESDELFDRMRRIAARGRIVLFVTHRLGELVAHSDRVAVIRDGRCAALLEGEGLVQDRIARELVVEAAGVPARNARAADGGGPPLLRVRDWRHRAFAVDALEVRRGEVVAIMGVEGSGARQLVASLAGLHPARGTVEVCEERGLRALLAHAAYVPASRRRSLFPNRSVAANVVSRLGRGRIASGAGLLRRRRIRALAEESRSTFAVRCASVDQPITDLSGGNQQKVAIAAALARRPALLVAEEPTRGVDIGSKAEIYGLLREFAEAGKGVVLLCTEVPEVFEVADRVLVMDRGGLSAPLEVGGYTSVKELAGHVAALEEHARASPRGAPA